MSVNESSKPNKYPKKDRNALKRQVRFEENTKRYQKECEHSLRLQEKYLKELEDGKSKTSKA